MMELLNVESAKSGKNHGWLGLQRSKPVYTPLSLRDWVRAAPRHPANASRHAKKFRAPFTVSREGNVPF